MADPDPGKSMSNRGCGWVRARLPLLMANRGDDPTESSDGAEDVSAEDRQRMEGHLAGCALCRQQQMILQQALCALSAAVADMPLEHGSPSLWPLLERRIKAHNTRRRVYWFPALHRLTDQWVQIRAILHEERALRVAWMRDTLGELIAGQKDLDVESGRKARLISGYSITAAVVIAFIALPLLRWRWVEAQSTIVANAKPLADAGASIEPTGDSLAGVENLDDDGEFASGHLAEADPVRIPDVPRAGSDGTLLPKHTPYLRFSDDLEHGAAAPLDTRETRPVY
jgi:hypothetical protein